MGGAPNSGKSSGLPQANTHFQTHSCAAVESPRASSHTATAGQDCAIRKRQVAGQIGVSGADEHVHRRHRDRYFMAMLQSLGIENGKPFAPDARQKKILEEAATVGEAMAKTIDFRGRLPGIRYRPDATWEYVIPPWFNVQQDVGNSTQFEERIALYYSALDSDRARQSVVCIPSSLRPTRTLLRPFVGTARHREGEVIGSVTQTSQ